MTRTREDLIDALHRLDGSGYGGYKRITGRYDLEDVDLIIDHVQSDPYAPPSSLRLAAAVTESSVPGELTHTRAQRTAVADFLARDLHTRLHRASRDLRLSAPGQEVLERTSVVLLGDAGGAAETIEVRLNAALPAAGRRIKGRAAAHLLTGDLLEAVRASALFAGMDEAALREHVRLHLDQLALRDGLRERGLVAFVGDGAVLPRSSGVSDRPLAEAVPFRFPDSLRVGFELPSGRTVTGMGVPRGITVIVGGGYHGKSTLLRAIERGVYPHVGGDGREWVLTDPDAVSVRAEDGRAVTGTDISAFITNLPSSTDTTAFSTANASGSTSQAANLAEALESGVTALLIDEDTSATNFMIRDAAMRELIPAGSEPITPFVQRIRALYEQRGVSTVLVAGGSGAFFPVADHIIAMEAYEPREVTDRARRIAARFPDEGPAPEEGRGEVFARPVPARVPDPASLNPQDKRKPARARGEHTIQFGRQDIDLAFLAQLAGTPQTAAIALSLELMARWADGRTSLPQLADRVLELLEQEGLDGLTGARRDPRGDLAMPRRHEILAAASRYRGLRLS
ncbi:ABC-ATPase domain-containing protein [Rothia kristinae]|uniref:ABC-ATPase domain-containing protein n=1 Tax=Rothia kristinae TaxID=37923 RepID=UPI0022E08A56|nr:ABC-ATPase domain-containing protein [Rothia kristinae]